jgi:CoA:oxalate CoA-transferase
METPAVSPGLNQHREAILNELMATDGAYSNAASDDVMLSDIDASNSLPWAAE